MPPCSACGTVLRQMPPPPNPMQPFVAEQLAGDALTLARRINHDLRSPLGAISTMAELLTEVLAKELPQHQALVAPIVSSADQMLELIKNINLLLRASYSECSDAMVSLDSVVDVALAKVETHRAQAGATVQKPDQWPEVRGEHEWLVAIWTNLLSNAMRHGGKTIAIGWDARLDGLALRFWVRDDGPGLSEDRAAEPFPAFETLHASANAGGIGLSITRRLVEVLGGGLTYQRLPEGWTEFAFELPTATAVAAVTEVALPVTEATPELAPEAAVPLAATTTFITSEAPTEDLATIQAGASVPATSDGHLRNVLDALFAFVGLLTPDGYLLEANAEALQAASLDPEDVIGMKLTETYWWTYSPEAQAQLQQAIDAAASGQVVRYEPKLRITPDLFILIDFSLSPLVDANGKVTHLVLSGLDLTRNLQTESALADSELRFRTMANNMSQFAWMADAKGAIFWYNQRWFDYTGTTLEDMQGWGWRNVHHPDHLERVVAKFKHCIQSGEVWEDTFPLRGVDGSFRWFLSRAIPVLDTSGQVVQWFGTNTDITDQLATEEALRRASQAKDDFIAVLSHELRTPLNPVLLIASEAATRTDLPDAVRADFEVIRRNIEVEARLIDDLLDLTRISRGKLPLVVSTVSADALVLEAVANVRGEAVAKGVRLNLELESGRTYLQGDDVRLRQVLWNVLRNAVKFTPAKGSVTVSTCDTGSRFQITVRDTGIGMTPEELVRVFEPFTQGDHSAEDSEQRFGGLGLGLAISKLLVEQHGGQIRASSQGRQQGTTIVIELPRSSDVPAAVESTTDADTPFPNPEAPSATGQELPMSILLVEDHDATRQTLAVILERRGHHVTQADSVATGYQHAMDGIFDLLMSDIGLPDGRGDELMIRIRDTQPALFGIALSGYGMEADIQRSRNAGFALHLTKPVSLQDLDRALRRVSRWRNATSLSSLSSSTDG